MSRGQRFFYRVIKSTNHIKKKLDKVDFSEIKTSAFQSTVKKTKGKQWNGRKFVVLTSEKGCIKKPKRTPMTSCQDEKKGEEQP